TARRARRTRGRARRRPSTHGRAPLRPPAASGSPARSGGLPLLSRFRDEVRREAVQLAPTQARDEEHALRRVLPLLDRRSERVELREPRAVLVRDEHPDGLPAVAETARKRVLQLVEALARAGGHLWCAGEAVREAPPADLVDAVDLVQNE